MRKLSLALSLIMLVSCLGISAFAVENTDTVRWDDEVKMTQSNGYPRMAERADGTLILTTDSGVGFTSTDNGQTWTKLAQRIVANASTSATYTKDGTEYTFSVMTRANFQPFVLEDGTVFLGYRFHTNTDSKNYTKGDPFYTSIRVMTSTDGGITYGNEQILVEDVNITLDNNGGTGHGFWEPFFLQIDENTIACYYADDLNIDKSGTNNNKHAKQRIAYVTYDIPTKTWDKTVHVAIYRGGGSTGISTRDGMPMATTLSDGSFAMVVEAQDLASWMKVGTIANASSSNQVYTNCNFVVGLSLSADGRTWSDPVPVFGPRNITAGNICAAPSIATLPDGRIIITCQTDETYNNAHGLKAETYTRAMGVAISDAPVTKDTVLTAIDPVNHKEDGAAAGFTRLEGVFDYAENQYCIWNAAFNTANDVYLLGTSGINAADATRSNGHILLRRLLAFKNADEAAVYDSAVARAGDVKYDYITIAPKAGKNTVTVETPAALSSAENFYVYELNGEFVTLKGSAAVGSDITFDANGKANYIVTEDEIVVYGDATGDGEINLKDAVRMLRQIVLPVDNTDIAACDIDGSLSVDVMDVLTLLRILV